MGVYAQREHRFSSVLGAVVPYSSQLSFSALQIQDFTPGTGDCTLTVRRFLLLVCRRVNSTFDSNHGCKRGVHNAKSRSMEVDIDKHH